MKLETQIQKLTEMQVLTEKLCEDGKARATICESVEDYGLDPDIYIAVVKAELGRAGVVNRNRRIYKVDEFVAQNEKLASRLDDEFIDGELGHPKAGPTFAVPARLIDVETSIDENTALATGKFAILNTSLGKDVLTLFKAGMEVGTSSRGSGVLDEMVLSDESEFAAANPDFIGETVGVVSDFLLDTYDLVRVPSAGTRVLSIEEASESGDADKEVCDMAEDTKPVADVAADDVLAKLDEDKKAVLLKIVEAVSLDEAPSDNRLAKEVAALREQLAVDRERQTVNEAQFVALREEVESLRAEKAKREHEDNVRAAIAECTDNRRFGGIVRGELELIVEGIAVEEIAGRAERLFTMIESTHTPIEAPVAQAAIDTNDDLVEEAAAEAVDTVLPQDIDEQLRRILGR